MKEHEIVFERLRKAFGTHSAAARALGYRHVTTYAQARRKGSLPSWRLDKAMQLLGDKQPMDDPKEAA
jgi:hypothetical protein